MDGLRIYAPPPRPTAAGAIDHLRATIREELAAHDAARHRADRVEARARGRAAAAARTASCPNCDMRGYYRAGRCCCCGYGTTPAVEHRTTGHALSDALRIEHAAAHGPIIGVR